LRQRGDELFFRIAFGHRLMIFVRVFFCYMR
jgi:hypothetical protein